jgi:hypothetical protein
MALFCYSNDSMAASPSVDTNTHVFAATAYAANQASADRQALNQLQQQLKDVVKQNSALCAGSSAKFVKLCDRDQHLIITQDYLPLLGIEVAKTSKNSVVAGSRVSLSAKESLPAYQTALNNEKAILENWSTKKDQVRGLQRNKLSKQDLSLQLARFYQLAMVAATLGDDSYLKTTFQLPPIDNSEESLKKFSSIDAAAAYIATKVITDKVFVFPLRPVTSVEVTPFGKKFHDALQSKMHSQLVSNPFGNYLLSGVYQAGDKELLVTYQMYSDDFLLQDRIRFKLPMEVANDLRVEPVAADFEQVFVTEETATPEGFRSEITTDIGSSDLLFRQGDTVRLYVRLSKPGYFYIVGHVAKQDTQYSYLLDVGEGEGSERFIKYVSPEQANQLIELGEFYVDPPYGVEYLQLVAATADLAKQLPDYRWDKNLEYYVVKGSEGDALNGVKKVRGLKKKRKNVQFHESQLVYTTASK